jgi:hypothetical protein
MGHNLHTTITTNRKSNNSNNNNPFSCSLDEKLVDKEQSYGWLKFGDIKGETEIKIVAAQDCAFSTNYLEKKFERRNLKADADYVKNTKKQLTT